MTWINGIPHRDNMLWTTFTGELTISPPLKPNHMKTLASNPLWCPTSAYTLGYVGDLYHAMNVNPKKDSCKAIRKLGFWLQAKGYSLSGKVEWSTEGHGNDGYLEVTNQTRVRYWTTGWGR
jgi:hypothetical protein